MKKLILSFFILAPIISMAQSPVKRESIIEAVKGVKFGDFRPRAEARWSAQYNTNLKTIRRTLGSSFAQSFELAVAAEIKNFPQPRKLETADGLDILCGTFEQADQNPAFKGAEQFVRCQLNQGFAYKRTSFGQYLDHLGDSDPTDANSFQRFDTPTRANGFKSLLSVNVAPPSTRLFKAWLMSELVVFAQSTSQVNLVTVRNADVFFADQLIQAYLQKNFLDQANSILAKNDPNPAAALPRSRLTFRTKTTSYSSGVGLDKATGRVNDLNFSLIFGGNDQFNIGPGTFRFGGVVVDRSAFAAKIGSWSFPIELYYYFDVIENYRAELRYGLPEFYVDLFNPVGTLWLSWGEAFAYPGNEQIRSIGYWTKILNY